MSIRSEPYQVLLFTQTTLLRLIAAQLAIFCLVMAACSTVVTTEGPPETSTTLTSTARPTSSVAESQSTTATTAIEATTASAVADGANEDGANEDGANEDGANEDGANEIVGLRFESRIGDVSTSEFATEALMILNDPRGWVRAGFMFEIDEDSPFVVVLAEGSVVDDLCLPLETYGSVSCQNGPVVALNAQRWRTAVDHWDQDLAAYRGYLVNHEVGHLLGQRHPTPRCPVAGRPAGVMEQQTGGLEGCTGNAWPRDWEIAHAAMRPVVYAPLPDWGPDPVPANGES